MEKGVQGWEKHHLKHEIKAVKKNNMSLYIKIGVV